MYMKTAMVNWLARAENRQEISSLLQDENNFHRL